MKISRKICALAGAAALLMPTIAMAITPEQNRNPETFNATYGVFINQMEGKLAPLLSTSSEYGRYIYVFLTGLSVIYAVFHLFRYVSGNANIGVLVEKGIYLLFVWGLMTSYSTVTYWVFGGFTELAGVMQKSILKDDKLMGPAVHLFKVAESLQWESGNILVDGVQSVALYFSTLILGLALAIVGALVAAWPVFGYFVAKIIGLSLIPTLLIPQLSSLFDGWMRLFFGFAIFTLVGRAVLVGIVLIAEILFGAAYGSAVPVSMLGTIDTIQDVLIADMFFLLGIVFLSATGFTVGKITGGGAVNVGVSSAMQTGARLLAGKVI